MKKMIVAHLDHSPPWNRKAGWVITLCLAPAFHTKDYPNDGRCLGLVDEEEIRA